MYTCTFNFPKSHFRILDGNHFESITEDLFAGCPALKSLYVRSRLRKRLLSLLIRFMRANGSTMIQEYGGQ